MTAPDGENSTALGRPPAHRQLGRAGESVSGVGLGCNTFGVACDQESARKVVQRALDVGINHFDTAAAYSDGVSEEYLGKALQGHRDAVVVATKTGVITDPEPRLTRRRIIQGLERSLRRLGTDYVDLYYLHFPDPSTPVEESLAALDDLVRSGKVVYPALSNFPGWQLADVAHLSARAGWAAPVVVQSQYSLLNRSVEGDVLPAAARFGMSIVAHSVLAGGFLTGKYRRGEAAPPGSRGYIDPHKTSDSVVTGHRWQARWLTHENFDKLDRFEAFARDHGKTVSELALAWVASQPDVCSVIVGASRPDHVDAAVRGAAWALTEADLQSL